MTVTADPLLTVDELSFRYQVPLDNETRQSMTMELPAHIFQAQILAESSKTMGLEVADFPAAQKTQNRQGKRVLGTKLARTSPAYAALLRGEAYTGKVLLFGRYYMADYRPIFDTAKQVVGVAFIGLDFTQSLQGLKAKIQAVSQKQNKLE